jgi:protein-disulfide isomerase
MTRFAVLTIVALVLGWSAVAGAAVPAAADARVQIPVEDSPTRGPADAPVTIVEFSDFLCPYSARGTQALLRTLENYPGQIRWVFKHFPLGRRAAGQAAHRAALAADAQGRFWDMHLFLFTNQRGTTPGQIVEGARSLGLDVEALVNDLSAPAVRERVRHDLELGQRLGVIATPTYFVNGVRIVGFRNTQEMRVIIERELGINPDRGQTRP